RRRPRRPQSQGRRRRRHPARQRRADRARDPHRRQPRGTPPHPRHPRRRTRRRARRPARAASRRRLPRPHDHPRTRPGEPMSTPAPTSASPAPALRARPGRLVPARVFIGRGLLHTIRNGEALLMAILLPTLLMLVFTYVFGGAMDPSGNYVDYVVPGIILTCAGFGASYTAVAVNVDMTTGIIDRFRTMPIPGTAVLVGHIV